MKRSNASILNNRLSDDHSAGTMDKSNEHCSRGDLQQTQLFSMSRVDDNGVNQLPYAATAATTAKGADYYGGMGGASGGGLSALQAARFGGAGSGGGGCFPSDNSQLEEMIRMRNIISTQQQNPFGGGGMGGLGSGGGMGLGGMGMDNFGGPGGFMGQTSEMQQMLQTQAQRAALIQQHQMMLAREYPHLFAGGMGGLGAGLGLGLGGSIGLGGGLGAGGLMGGGLQQQIPEVREGGVAGGQAAKAEEDLEEELDASIRLRIAAERKIKHLEQELKDEKVRGKDLEKRLEQHQEHIAKLLETAKSHENALLTAHQDIQSLKQEKALLKKEKASLLMLQSQREGNKRDKVVENAMQSKQRCTPSQEPPRRLVSTISTGSTGISPPAHVAGGDGSVLVGDGYNDNKHSGSESRKRRGDVSSNGLAKKKKKKTIKPPNWSAEKKEELILNNEEFAKAESKFIRKRDRIVSQFPNGIGDIGVVKSGSKTFVVLVCHPYHVPPSPVREDWLKLHFKGNRTSRVIVYWYGQTQEKRMYGYVRLSSIKPYSGREKGLALNKTGIEQLREDLMKNPAERRRGVVDFLESYQMLGNRR